MATKVEKSEAAGVQPAASGEDHLSVLHPNRELVIGHRVVTVREYGFIEGLKLHAEAKPFIDGLYDLAARGAVAPSFEDVEQLLVEHQECVLTLMAAAADVDRAWIETLSDDDGYRLMQEWWLANCLFFIRRVKQRLVRNQVHTARPGPASTAPSSAPASGEVSKTSESSHTGS